MTTAEGNSTQREERKQKTASRPISQIGDFSEGVAGASNRLP